MQKKFYSNVIFITLLRRCLKKDLWLNKNRVSEGVSGIKPTHKTINYNQNRLINYHYRFTAEYITFVEISPPLISEKNCH